MRRIRAIYLDPPGPLSGWGKAVIDATGDRHDLTVYNYDLPLDEQFANVEAVIDQGGTNFSADMLRVAPDVRFWQMITVGFDRVDLAPARDAGIAVAHCPGATSADALAETALMFMLMLSRKYGEAQEHIRLRRLHGLTVDDLDGQVLGLIGFGASGRALGRRARALGMRLMIIEPLPIEQALLDEVQPSFVGKPDATDKVMAEADFVSLHLTLTSETRGSIDARRIGLMKPTACLINVARGAIVDEAALHKALIERRIGGIGIDVFNNNNVATSLAMLEHPRFVALPHIGGTSTKTYKKRAEIASDNLDRLAQEMKLKHLVVEGKGRSGN